MDNPTQGTVTDSLLTDLMAKLLSPALNFNSISSGVRKGGEEGEIKKKKNL